MLRRNVSLAQIRDVVAGDVRHASRNQDSIWLVGKVGRRKLRVCVRRLGYPEKVFVITVAWSR